jgi:hypothetical protein
MSPEALEAAIAEIERTAQVPAQRGVRAIASTASGRLALAAGLLVTVVVAGGIAARAMAPAPVRPASPGGSGTVAAADRSYISRVFGYRLEVPAGWTVRDPLAHPSFLDAAGELRAVIMTSSFDWDRRDWAWGNATRPYSVTGTTLAGLMAQVRASAEAGDVDIVADEAVVLGGVPARRLRATIRESGLDTTTVITVRGEWQQTVTWFGPPVARDGASVDEFLDSFLATHEIGTRPSGEP